MHVKLLNETRIFTALPDGKIFYDFHLWKGCIVKIVKRPRKKKEVQKIGRRKVIKIQYKGNDHFVLTEEFQRVYKEPSE